VTHSFVTITPKCSSPLGVNTLSCRLHNSMYKNYEIIIIIVVEAVNKYVRVPFLLRSGVRIDIMCAHTLRAIILGQRLIPDFTVLLRDNLKMEELVVFRVSCTDSGYPETGYNTKLKRAWIWSSDRCRHGIVSPIIRKGVTCR
jgi:hypothetical protein